MIKIKFPLLAIVLLLLLLMALCVSNSRHKRYIDEFDAYAEVQSDENGDDDSDWPDSIFECVSSCSFLSELEKDVVVELNKCRTDPARYADEVLVPFLERMGDDGVYVDLQGLNNMTNEGRSAVQEAIDALKSQKPLPMLLPNQDLSLAATDHCEDQGPKGNWGHDSSDGSSVADRVKRYNSDLTYIGENISYGESKGFDIIRQLIVDDGVPSRGHRENIFRDYKYVGVGFGSHKKYRYMCVLDFAERAVCDINVKY